MQNEDLNIGFSKYISGFNNRKYIRRKQNANVMMTPKNTEQFVDEF